MDLLRFIIVLLIGMLLIGIIEDVLNLITSIMNRSKMPREINEGKNEF